MDPVRVHIADRSTYLKAAQRVLEALGSSIPKPEFIPLLAGWEEFKKNGVALPEETIRLVFVFVKNQILSQLTSSLDRILKEECDGAMFGSVRSVTPSPTPRKWYESS